MTPTFRRLWPDPAGPPLDAAALEAAYRPPPAPSARPAVTVNFVTSADGAVTLSGRTAGLAGPGDEAVFTLLRRGCDALLVGAGTLRNERYGPLAPTASERDGRRAAGLAEAPVLVVVSGRLDLEPDHPALARAPVRPVVVTHGAAPADRRRALAAVADVVVHGAAEVDLPAALADLRGRGVTRLLCEGGPWLFGALTGADLVDDLCLTIAPLLAGPGSGRITAGSPSPARGLTLSHVLAAGDELLLRYARASP